MTRLAPITIALVLLVSACGGQPVGETTSTEPTTTTVETTTTIQTTTTSEASALPDGWTRCENQALGYTVGHPADWYTTSLGGEDRCRWFDPEPFELEPATEGPVVALEVRVTERPFHVDELAEPGLGAELVTAEETEVNGRPALIREDVLVEDGFYPEGTRIYSVFVSWEGEVVLLQTVALPEIDLDTYRVRTEIVDQATRTLVLDG